MADKKAPPGGPEKPKKSEIDSQLDSVRQKIRTRIALAEEAKKLSLQRQRIVLAGRGVQSYDDRNLAEAARSFKGYIKILEDLKGVPPGGLMPSHFDKAKEIPELMLISGVYWDLVKLYDRTRSAERYVEFKGYLAKYIQFTKGTAFQAMGSETMRKYIQARRPVHRNDLKEAYKQIAVSKCFIATELVDFTSPETIPNLRGFRDQYLKRSKPGRAFVAWYYRNGKKLASRMGRSPAGVKWISGKGLDLFSSFLPKDRSSPQWME